MGNIRDGFTITLPCGIIEAPIRIYPTCAIMNNRASTSPGSALGKYLLINRYFIRQNGSDIEKLLNNTCVQSD